LDESPIIDFRGDVVVLQSRNLAGRIAVVTGASRSIGIGAAICRRLADQGADIFFTHWRPYDESMPWGADPDYPEKLKVELSGLGVRVGELEVDLARPSASTQVLDAVEMTLGRPSILINNAAHSTHTPYLELDAAALDAHYAVNIRAACLLSVEFARRFSAGHGGRIISLTSGQALGAMPNELAYIATKGAIEAFTLSLSAGVAHLGITVNAVNPGPVDTGYMSEELRRALLPRFPFGRMGEPADVARLVGFLASDDAAWITGQVIHSEGGFRDG
jgi:3-oxoacyl-[acyl-carrier protein] reductase